MIYKTQMEAAKKGIITKEMGIVSDKENIEAEKLRQKGGARGNSGVITSLLFRGFSKALEGKKAVSYTHLTPAATNCAS